MYKCTRFLLGTHTEILRKSERNCNAQKKEALRDENGTKDNNVCVRSRTQSMHYTYTDCAEAGERSVRRGGRGYNDV